MGERLVVALVCEAVHPYNHGGREHRYYELARRLADRFELHVYTMRWWSGPRVYVEDGITFHAISPLYPPCVKNRRSIKQAVLFSLACLRLFLCHFDVLDADHIPHFQLIVLRFVTLLKRKPLVATWHEVWSREYWLEYLGWLGLAGWLIERLAMLMPNAIIAASPYTAQRLMACSRRGSSITTVPNGIDLAEIGGIHPEADVHDLVVVGRLFDHKHVDMILEAIALLHGRGTAVTCRIVGDGPERDALHEQVLGLGISHLVTFHHDVREPKDVYALVKSSRVFVSASAREGFGIAVLEALACGIGVVTTSAPDNLAQHLAARSRRGMVCEPSVDSIAHAVQQSIAEYGRPSYSASGSDPWLAEYDWDLMAERVAKVYLSNALTPRQDKRHSRTVTAR